MNLASLFNDPPPSYAFEISEAGIASAEIAKAPETSFHPLSSRTISVSPLRDNILMPDELAAAVRGLVPANGNRKRTLRRGVCGGGLLGAGRRGR